MLDYTHVNQNIESRGADAMLSHFKYIKKHKLFDEVVTEDVADEIIKYIEDNYSERLY